MSKSLQDVYKILESLKLETPDDVELLDNIKMKVLSFERTAFLETNLKIDKRKYKVKKDFKPFEIPYLAKPTPKLAEYMEKYHSGDAAEGLFDLTHFSKWTLERIRGDEKEKKVLFDFGEKEKFAGFPFLDKLCFTTGLNDLLLVEPEKGVVADEGGNILDFPFGKSFRRVASTSAKARYSNPMDHVYLFERMHYTKMSYTKFFPVRLTLLHGKKKEKKRVFVLMEKSKVTKLVDYAVCERENNLVSTFKDRLRALFKILNHDKVSGSDIDWEDAFQDAGHVVAVSSSAQDTIAFTSNEHDCMIEAFSHFCERDISSSLTGKEKAKWDKADILKEMSKSKDKNTLYPPMNFPPVDEKTSYLCFLNGILQDSQVNQVYYRNVEKLIQKIRKEFKEFDKMEVLVRHDQFYDGELKKYFPYLKLRNWNYDKFGLITKTIPHFFLVTVMTMNKIKSRKINEMYIFFIPNNVNKYYIDKSCREVSKELKYYPNDSFKKYSYIKNPKTDLEIFNWMLDRIYRFGVATLPSKPPKKKVEEEVESKE